MQSFAENLQARAQQLELSNAEVARRAGLTERRYAHYVAGTREPDLATLVRIAETLKTTPNHLLGAGTSIARPTWRQLMLDRVAVAADALTDGELDIVLVQIEAIAARPR